MEETIEPTREQIVEWLATHFAPASIDDERAVLRSALRTLDAEKQLAAMTERAERAEREWYEAFDRGRAKLAAMHRRAQRAESATADARREAIVQRMRADWWRREAKRLGWQSAYEVHEAYLASRDQRHPEPSPERIDRESKPALDDLIEASRSVVMTPEQREAQRRSFAYGNVAIENPSVTREHIDVAAERLDYESSSLLLLSTWARRVMTRPKNRAKGLPSDNEWTLIDMIGSELEEAREALHHLDDSTGATRDAAIDETLSELGDVAACVAFLMREIESRRNR